jgi:hypothetical protein
MRREQRRYFRFPVEGEAMLFVEQTQSSMRCHMLDLALEGCRLRRTEDLPVQIGLTVKVAFRIAGTLFRFPGTIQWSARNSILGLHFTQMSSARKQELSDLLDGMREEMEAREKEKQAKPAEQQSQQDAPANTLHLVPKNPAANSDAGTESIPGAAPEAGSETGSETSPEISPEISKDQPAASLKRERREHFRHELDSHARVLFLSIHSRVIGKVIDLSLGGCRIRAQQRIPVGAYRRVEVEFIVDGLPLLLPGVTQALHDKYTIGIRFVEMTDRKRGQLRLVIEEIEQRNAEAVGHA